MSEALSRHLVIGPEYTGMRLDVFLTGQLESSTPDKSRLSRSEIQRMIDDGEVTLNGAATKPSARIRAADAVHVLLKAPRDATLRAEALPLDVLYEDSHCIVVNKSPGLTVHPGAGHWSGTLVNALLYRWPALEGVGGVRRPGIVHRLDKDTSGVMIIAKNAAAYQHLASQFQNRTVEKEYLAVAWGRIQGDRGSIDWPVGRHRVDRKKMSSRQTTSRSRAALTEWRVMERFQTGADAQRLHTTLLALRPHTGRTHQLRVHLADLGHPIVGDPVYGGSRQDSRISVPHALANFNRQALHAHKLTVVHPHGGTRVTFTAPLASDLVQLLQDLRKHRAATDSCGTLSGG